MKLAWDGRWNGSPLDRSEEGLCDSHMFVELKVGKMLSL